MKETGDSISKWAVETFGPASSDARVATRANREMSELLEEITKDAISEADIAEECADIVIVLTRLANRCGRDIFDEVDRKMEINRKREWRLDGSGHGYHVKEKPVAPPEAPPDRTERHY